MQEATGRTSEPVREPRGARALLGAAIAMVGALATVHPTNVLLVTLSEVVPQLAAALPLAAVSFRAGWAGSSDLSWVGRGGAACSSGCWGWGGRRVLPIATRGRAPAQRPSQVGGGRSCEVADGLLRSGAE